MPTPKQTKESLNRRQRDYMVASNDATIVRTPGIPQRPINPHLTERGLAGARAHRAWEEAHPIASTLGKIAGAIPLAVATYPIVAGLGFPAAGKAAATASKVATGASRAFPQVTRHLMTGSVPKAAMMQTAGGQSIAVPLTTTMQFPWQGIGYGTAATGLSLGSGVRSLAESASLADAAEATPAESSTDTAETASTTPPENKPNQEKPDEQKPEDKKPLPKKGRFRQELDKAKDNVGSFYKNIGEKAATGLGRTIGYGIGYGAFPATGYGIYKLATYEPPTQLDSIQRAQQGQLRDLQQLQNIHNTQREIDRLKQGLNSNTSQAQGIRQDTIIPIIRTHDGQVTGSTQEELDSINSAWFGGQSIR